MFYICSLALGAAEFAQQIQQHWHVENRLYWERHGDARGPCFYGGLKSDSMIPINWIKEAKQFQNQTYFFKVQL